MNERETTWFEMMEEYVTSEYWECQGHLAVEGMTPSREFEGEEE